MRALYHRIAAMILVATVVMVSLSGCGGSIAGDAVLRVASLAARITDSDIPDRKWVRIMADVVSGRAVRRAIAKIIRPSGQAAIIIDLALNPDGKYETLFKPDSVVSPTQLLEYQVEVTVTDSAGVSVSSEPVSVQSSE